MVKKKKSIGDMFMDKFLDLREKRPEVVTEKVSAFLEAHNIPFNKFDTHKDSKFNLISEYFCDCKAFVLHLYPGRTDTALVGKGCCFDSGGYSIKPSRNMGDMFHDKRGALDVIATSLDTKTTAFVFFVNNCISQHSTVPGEIIKDNLTDVRVYVDNVDAEGRIGLANLTALAEQEGHNTIINVATLTGAASYCTGNHTYACISSNNKKDYTLFTELWIKGNKLQGMLPHHKFDDAVKSKVKNSDITNSPNFYGAGHQTAFSFLKAFVKKPNTKVVLLDIAGISYDHNGNGVDVMRNELKTLIKTL